MGEIKFRAWSNGKYHYDGFVVYPDGKTEWPEAGWDLHGYDDKIEIEQFTGFHDADGTEIYEGDIVNAGYDNLSVYVDGKPRVVHMGFGYDSDGWAHGSWYGWKCGESSLADVRKECSVIGNIHENKELLEEK